MQSESRSSLRWGLFSAKQYLHKNMESPYLICLRIYFSWSTLLLQPILSDSLFQCLMITFFFRGGFDVIMSTSVVASTPQEPMYQQMSSVRQIQVKPPLLIFLHLLNEPLSFISTQFRTQQLSTEEAALILGRTGNYIRDLIWFLSSAIIFQILLKSSLFSNSDTSEQVYSCIGRLQIQQSTNPCSILLIESFSFFHLLFKDSSFSLAYEAKQSCKFMSLIKSQCFSRLQKL